MNHSSLCIHITTYMCINISFVMLCAILYRYIFPKVSLFLSEWIRLFQSVYYKNTVSCDQKKQDIQSLSCVYDSLLLFEHEEKAKIQDTLSDHEDHLNSRYDNIKNQALSRNQNRMLGEKKNRISHVVFEFMKKKECLWKIYKPTR